MQALILHVFLAVSYVIRRTLGNGHGYHNNGECAVSFIYLCATCWVRYRKQETEELHF